MESGGSDRATPDRWPPPDPRWRWSWRAERGPLAFFALATVVLTWPLLAAWGESLSLRTDYISNVWNIWWVRRALFEEGVSPYHTELLYHPLGISLARHTLSPINAFAGAALALVMGLHDAYRCVLAGHFWLSAVAGYALARYLTGSRHGAVLAGLAWSFAPYHMQCLDRINLASMEGLPWIALCLLRVRREGGARNLAWLLVAVAWQTGTCYYYVVYAALLGALLVAGGALVDRATPFWLGTRRLAVAGLGAGVVALLAAWPLVASALAWDPTTSWVSDQRLTLASNDLLGFRWIVGPPSTAFVSWPTMLGWSCLAVMLAGARSVVRQPFWFALVVVGLVLGLGQELTVRGEETGVRLPYELLVDLPVVGSMLRRPGRVFVLAQLGFTVLLAAAYRDLAARLASTAARRALLGMTAALVAFELAAVPLKTFPMTVSPLFEQLPEDARSLVELPPGIADINVRQMVHGRRAVGGYVTNLALDAEHEELAKAWKDAWDLVVRDHSTRRLEELVAESGVDLVVLDRQEYENVVPPYAGQVVWRPLCLARGLVWAKQDAPYREVPTRGLARATAMLVDLYGKPILSDDRVLVFRAR